MELIIINYAFIIALFLKIAFKLCVKINNIYEQNGTTLLTSNEFSLLVMRKVV